MKADSSNKKVSAQMRSMRKKPFKHRARQLKTKAKRLGVPFDIDEKYLEEIWTGTCPVFHTRLSLPFHADRSNVMSKYVSSLDRIIPENGYVQGNVEWISNAANAIKQRSPSSDLFRVAEHVQQREKDIHNYDKSS